MNAAPTITTQPLAQTVTLGQPANFSVQASGTPTPTFQWSKSGVAISGAVGGAYTTTATTKVDNGAIFSVAATNSLGTATSTPATLTVQWAPTITTQPGNQTVTAGQPAVFTAVADGNPGPSYQWQRNGQNILGATSTSYTVPTTVTADSGSIFTVVVSNGLGSITSNPASLTVNPAPVAPAITTQPLATTVQAGQLASFSVAATGTAPLTYQWRKNASAVPSGGTASTFSIASAQAADAGTYDVVINNITNQPVTSTGAALTVNPAQVPPTIATQPLDVVVVEGNSASFTVVANGSTPLNYQWQKNLTDIPNATLANYTLSSANMADSGASFRCRVSNAVGPIYSNAALLTVTPAPQAPVITSFTATPSTLTLGQPTMLSWAVTGANSLSIDNGVGSVTGLTSKQVTPTNTGTLTYWLTATNGVGSTPASTQVVVNQAPSFGLSVSLGTGVTGTPGTTTSYSQGTVVNYSYSLQAGYQNLLVSLDGSPVAASGTVTMNAAHALVATSVPDFPSITSFSPSSGPVGSVVDIYGTSLMGTSVVRFNGVSAGGVTQRSNTQVSVYVPAGASTGYIDLTTPSGTTTSPTVFTVTQTYTITAMPGPNGIISPSGVTSVNSGGSQTYTISPNSGYQVANVTVDGVSVGAVSNYTFTNVTGNHTIAATFNLPVLTVSLGAGVTGTPTTTATYSQGTLVNYSYSLYVGYQNLQVTLDGSPVAASGTVTMNGSHTLAVTSSAIPTYELTVSLGPGVTGTPATTTSYPQGTLVSYSYTLQPGYQFLNVSLNSGSASPSGTVLMNQPYVLAASAQIKTFAITASVGANGTISPSGSTSVTYGSSLIYTIAPSNGFQVADVLVDGVSVGAVTSYTFNNVTSAHTIYANFSSPQALLTVSRSVGISGTPATTTSYSQGTVVNYSYSLQAGYQNLLVSLDGSPVAASGTVTMNGPHTLAASATQSTPTITSFTPSSGPVGTSVMIYGNNLENADWVTFNGKTANIVSNSPTAINAIVPPGASSGPIQVVTPNGSAVSASNFTVTSLPVPIISNFSPGYGSVGSSVQITGLNLSGVYSILFNGVASPSFSVISDTFIDGVKVPTGATTGKITILSTAGSSISLNDYIVTNLPIISGFSPNSGPVGTTVIISGSYFNGASSVTFGGVQSTFIVDSDTQITAVIPYGASTGPIIVTTLGGAWPSMTDFIVTGTPSIGGFSPSYGPPGTVITITGSNLINVQSVKFNGINASFTVHNGFYILAVVPSGATTGKINIKTDGGITTSLDDFIVQ